MNKDTFIKISNEYIKDSNKILSSQELSLLTVMSMNKTVKDQIIITMSWLVNQFNIKTNLTRKVNDFKKILKTLKDNKVLQFYNSTMQDNETIINIEDVERNQLFYIDNDIDLTENFTIIYDYEIRAIIDYASNNKIDYYGLLNIFIYIISYINNNEKDEYYKLCFPSYLTIHDEIGLSENTISKYIKILKDINLLRYDYAGYKETAKGKIKNDKMYYCRYEDERHLIERINRISNTEGYIKLNNKSKDKSNAKRSIKQSINSLKSKYIDGSITEVEKASLNILEIEYKKIDIKEDKEN